MAYTLRIAIQERASQLLRASTVGDVELDAASARDLDFFVTHVQPTANDILQRPVVLWRGKQRVVVDVIARFEDDVWHLEFGDERPDADAPDQRAVVDGRLHDLATPVWVTDAERLARWFNPAWCDFVGSEIDDELGWGWMRHVHPDDLVGLLEAYEDAQREGRGFAYVGRLTDRDGRFRWAQVKAVPRLADGAFAGFIGMCAIYGREDELRPHASSVLAFLPGAPPEPADAVDVIERLEQLETSLRIVRPAQIAETVVLRRVAAAWIAQDAQLRERQDEIVLAVDEAATDAVLHGRSAVELHCTRRDDLAEFRIRDWGSWEVPPRDHDGRGVEIMRALSDEFELHHHDDGTEVVLRYVLQTS
jgi:PAS domain S-box-containing protein